jgi:hypothetical protein
MGLTNRQMRDLMEYDNTAGYFGYLPIGLRDQALRGELTAQTVSDAADRIASLFPCTSHALRDIADMLNADLAALATFRRECREQKPAKLSGHVLSADAHIESIKHYHYQSTIVASILRANAHYTIAGYKLHALACKKALDSYCVI